MTVSMENHNPEIDQDRVFDLVDHFNKFGHPLFPQQLNFYKYLAQHLKGRGTVLEAGCGNGVGTALLDRTVHTRGTDKLSKNVSLAQALYPWIEFFTWDLNEPTQETADIVVCIEVFEHVANPQAAMNHLIAAARSEVWLMTPNGYRKPRPPENPYHVCEYTIDEMLDFIGNHEVSILDGETFKYCSPPTTIDSLVYHIKVAQ